MRERAALELTDAITGISFRTYFAAIDTLPDAPPTIGMPVFSIPSPTVLGRSARRSSLRGGRWIAYDG